MKKKKEKETQEEERRNTYWLALKTLEKSIGLSKKSNRFDYLSRILSLKQYYANLKRKSYNYL